MGSMMIFLIAIWTIGDSITQQMQTKTYIDTKQPIKDMTFRETLLLSCIACIIFLWTAQQLAFSNSKIIFGKYASLLGGILLFVLALYELFI